MLTLRMAVDPPHQDALGDIVDLIAHVAVPGRLPITPATELYYDLGLAGDDLYEAIAAIRARFGTDFSMMHLADFAPGETEALFSFDLLRRLLGRPRRYHSLTVQSLVEAVHAGAWKVV